MWTFGYYVYTLRVPYTCGHTHQFLLSASSVNASPEALVGLNTVTASTLRDFTGWNRNTLQTTL